MADVLRRNVAVALVMAATPVAAVLALVAWEVYALAAFALLAGAGYLLYPSDEV